MELFKRENYLSKIRGFYDSADIIKVITGVRRCGKSCLMETIASELSEKGVDEKNIVFIDLDKRGYRGVKSANALEKLIDERGDAEGWQRFRGTRSAPLRNIIKGPDPLEICLLDLCI